MDAAEGGIGMEENDYEVNSEIVEVRCPVCEQYVTVVTESPEQGEVYTECPECHEVNHMTIEVSYGRPEGE